MHWNLDSNGRKVMGSNLGWDNPVWFEHSSQITESIWKSPPYMTRSSDKKHFDALRAIEYKDTNSNTLDHCTSLRAKKKKINHSQLKEKKQAKMLLLFSICNYLYFLHDATWQSETSHFLSSTFSTDNVFTSFSSIQSHTIKHRKTNKNEHHYQHDATFIYILKIGYMDIQGDAYLVFIFRKYSAAVLEDSSSRFSKVELSSSNCRSCNSYSVLK